jgi:hypothetical protein
VRKPRTIGFPTLPLTAYAYQKASWLVPAYSQQRHASSPNAAFRIIGPVTSQAAPTHPPYAPEHRMRRTTTCPTVVSRPYSPGWMDGQGAAGFTGLTLHATAAGRPTASLTLAGYSQADMASERNFVSFGNDPASGSSYHVYPVVTYSHQR